MKSPKRGWKIAIIAWIIALVCLSAAIISIVLKENFIWAAIGLACAAMAFVFPFCEKEQKKDEEPKSPLSPDDEFAKVKILGTRTGEQTKLFGTENFTVYSFLVEYKSGRREVIECTQEDEQFKYLIGCADIDEK